MQRVQRGSELIDLASGLILQAGDRVVVSARRAAFPDVERELGPEIDDAELLSVAVRTAAVVVTRSDVIGTTLGDLARDPNVQGVYLESVQRATELMPRQAWTVLQRGDIVRIACAPDAVARFTARVSADPRFGSSTAARYAASTSFSKWCMPAP